MAAESTEVVNSPTTSSDNTFAKVKFVVVAVPASLLLLGIATPVLHPRFALFPAAVIIGWTQLVGL